jgi:hypothetical protein
MDYGAYVLRRQFFIRQFHVPVPVIFEFSEKTDRWKGHAKKSF